MEPMAPEVTLRRTADRPPRAAPPAEAAAAGRYRPDLTRKREG